MQATDIAGIIVDIINDITDEDTCQATKCGPKQDRTDCAWMGGARGCRCPSGACATVGQ